MKIIIFLFTVLFYSQSLQGTCSVNYKESFIVNEINSWDNWIELYRNPSNPPPSILSGWHITVCRNNDSKTCETRSFNYNYPADGSFPVIQFLNKDTVSSKDSIEILVTDDTNKTIDYLNLQQGNNPISILLEPQISTCNFITSCKYFSSPNSGERDFFRVPDGGCSLQEDTGRYNNTKGASNTGAPLPPVYCTSLQYNLYHNFNSSLIPPYRLQTRISQQDFDLNITIACTGTGTIPPKKITQIYAVANNDPCTSVPTSSSQLLWSGSNDINDTVRTINIMPLYSQSAYSNTKLMLKTDANELYCSSDTLAIRPPFYTISSPSSPIKATNFTLQLSAANSGTGYSGTASIATGLQTANPNCPVSSGFLKSSLGSTEPLSVTFLNDTNSSAMKATDVGAVYLNTKDTTWTAVDQPNDCIGDSNTTIANAQGLFGCTIESNVSLVIVPNNFDVNSTLTNANGGFFTYLSNDLNMSAQLALNITAKNGEGNTTRNYDKGCYAKSTTLTLPHTLAPDPLTKIFYHETLSATDGNVSKSSDIILSLANSVFTQGVAPLQLNFNFDRDRSKPLNPFYFNFTAPTVSDADLVTNGTGVNTMVGTSTFLYGRVRAYDIATNISPVSVPIEFEVYSAVPTGYVSAMPQNVLKWYRNLNHTAAVQGNVLRGGFSAGTTSGAVNVSAPPQNGIQVITLTSAADQTVHLDITPWLWYSPGYNYDYTGGCTQHPCFIYDYTNAAAGVSGVSSGTFQGSDFQMAPAQNITNKGVKVFR